MTVEIMVMSGYCLERDKNNMCLSENTLVALHVHHYCTGSWPLSAILGCLTWFYSELRKCGLLFWWLSFPHHWTKLAYDDDHDVDDDGSCDVDDDDDDDGGAAVDDDGDDDWQTTNRIKSAKDAK